MRADLYRDVIFNAVVGVVDAPGVVRPRVTRTGAVRMAVILLCQSGVKTRLTSLGSLFRLCPVQVSGES